jgi:hypothetical protein
MKRLRKTITRALHLSNSQLQNKIAIKKIIANLTSRMTKVMKRSTMTKRKKITMI